MQPSNKLLQIKAFQSGEHKTSASFQTKKYHRCHRKLVQTEKDINLSTFSC